jgi:hypothetical protein
LLEESKEKEEHNGWTYEEVKVAYVPDENQIDENK